MINFNLCMIKQMNKNKLKMKIINNHNKFLIMNNKINSKFKIKISK